VRLVLVVSGALAALAFMAGPVEAGGSCSLAAAKQALGATKIFGTGLGPPVRLTVADAVICSDLTRDGRVDMAVTIASGGTAGDIAFVVFRSTSAGWRIALNRGGYKLGLVRLGGDLVQTQPVYRKNDPNCCPTGGFDHDRWHWDGDSFVIVRSWHDKRFRA
jgi:hypothetical protein